MKKLNKLLTYLTVFLVLVNAVSCKLFEAESPLPGDLLVTVQMNDGTKTVPVENATVYTRPTTKTQLTNSYGTVSLIGLTRGSYEVYATVPGVASGMTVTQIDGSRINTTLVTIKYGSNVGLLPEISLLSPKPDTTVNWDTELTFQAKITDSDSPLNTVKVQWESQLDGILNQSSPDASGLVTFRKKLSKGKHTIKIVATDPDDHSTSTSFEISTEALKTVTISKAEKEPRGNIELEWTKYDDPDFSSYELYIASSANPEDRKLLFKTEDANILKFLDTQTGYVDQVFYTVRVITNNGAHSDSKTVEFRPEDQSWEMEPFELLKHPTENLVYLLDRKARSLSVWDVPTRTPLKMVSVPGTSGRLDIGNNGFGTEIYLPGDDGWIYCIDAATLVLKKWVNTGQFVTSVASGNNGYLVASLNGLRTKPLISINRASGKEVVSGTIVLGKIGVATYLSAIPNTNNFIAVSSLVNPPDINFLEYSSLGHLTTVTAISQSRKNEFDPDILRVSPDSKYLITNQNGVIYSATRGMEYKGQVQGGSDHFSDFAFSTDGSTIYAGTRNRKSVQVFEYPGLTRKGEILLKGYPVFLAIQDQDLVILLREPENPAKIGMQVISLEQAGI